MSIAVAILTLPGTEARDLMISTWVYEEGLSNFGRWLFLQERGAQELDLTDNGLLTDKPLCYCKRRSVPE